MIPALSLILQALVAFLALANVDGRADQPTSHPQPIADEAADVNQQAWDATVEFFNHTLQH